MKRHSLPALLILTAVLHLFSASPAAAGDSWRSTLYPTEWSPSFSDAQGRFLHDFSYAGYGNGKPLPQVKAKLFDVKARGADPTGAKDSTAAFRSAIDDAAKAGGGIVVVPAGEYRIDGALEIRDSKIVLRGAGPDKSRLRFTKLDGMNNKAHLTFSGNLEYGPCKALAADSTARCLEIVLADVSGLKQGDAVAIGIVDNEAFRADHGMEKYWAFSAGKWRPLFRRTIRAVDARRKAVLLDVPLRYDLKTAWGAALCPESGYLRECGIESIGVSNACAYEAAWKTNQVAAVEMSACADSWVREVESYAAAAEGSKGAHLVSCGIRVRDCKRVTVANCSMQKPAHRGGGGNGYLFELRTSNEILTVDCSALEGRHNFIQNWDFGCTGCVWLRVQSKGSVAFVSEKIPMGLPAVSEYHHALAMANLVDSCLLDDGFCAVNRGKESSGAGHTSTQCVFWNNTGKGRIQSCQFGWGYVIGTGPDIKVFTGLRTHQADGTEPEDFTEGIGSGAGLEPKSLYEDQLSRRRR